MKNKIIIIIGVILIIVLVIAIFIILNNNSSIIKLKGNMLYGEEVCDKALSGNDIFFGDDMHSNIGLTVMSNYRCALCGKKYTYGSSPTPVICDKCSKTTNRCKSCGKLLGAM